MKKNISKIFISFSILALFCTGCASTQKSDSISGDEYDTAEQTQESDELDTDFSSTDEKGTKANKKGKKKNALESFFTFGNKDDFISNDVTAVFTRTVTGSIKQKKASIMINPEKQTAGFGSTYMSAYYIVQLDAESRAKLAKAVELYLNDFENKKLDRKDRKSYKKYGQFNIHLDWGTISSSTPNFGDGTAYFGYEFEKGSPYFSITCYPMHNKYWDIVNEATSEQSLQLKYFFTKALAQELVDFISEEKISSFFEDYVSDTIFTPAELDDYE